MSSPEKTFPVPEDAYETGAREGTLGGEEELWLADQETYRLAGGGQDILANSEEGHFSGELIDCEIESNTAVHRDPESVTEDFLSRRRELLGHADRLGRFLGVSGTHPVGDWREQKIIDKPHYRRLEEKLGWLIRRNNTFALHVHYAVNGKEKAIYLYNRLREYVPHFLALSVNSPFWQGEITDMQSSRILIFSRSIHRAGLPEQLHSWQDYIDYVDYVTRPQAIHSLGEIWWDVRPHPSLGTVEMRAPDAQTAPWRTGALVSLTAALCATLSAEYDANEKVRILPSRMIEENKWSAQRYGLEGAFLDPETYRAVPTRGVLESLVEYIKSPDYDLSGVERILSEPTEADRQLEVYRETNSTTEVAHDIIERTRTPAESG